MGFGYKAVIPLAGVTADMVADVYFWPYDAVNRGLSPVAETTDGAVCIYAGNPIQAYMTIPTIRVTK